jgi:hypothetical protein
MSYYVTGKVLVTVKMFSYGDGRCSLAVGGGQLAKDKRLASDNGFLHHFVALAKECRDVEVILFKVGDYGVP